MKRKLLSILILISMLILIPGCSDEEGNYAETTITVEKKGRVRESIVDTFDKDYYNIEELKAEFADSVEHYNEAIGGEEIKLRKIDLNESKVYVYIEFT